MPRSDPEFVRFDQRAEPLRETRNLKNGKFGPCLLIGVARARQMSVLDRPKWLEELGRHRSASLGALGWLWVSILELMASHEVAYLEHCRRYVIAPAAAV